MKRLRAHLTYANVIATLALFIALAGGTAVAAKQLLPNNSVGTKQLKNNSITAAKVKNGAITSSKIALSSLGTVPNAAHADSATSAGTAESAKIAGTATNATNATTATTAQSLQGLSPAQIAALSKLTCPADTKLVAGTCFETAQRPAANWETAVRTCAKAGRFLPNAAQLTTFDILGPSNESEWTSELQYTSDLGYRAVVLNITTNGYSLNLVAMGGAGQAYRCIVPPSN